MNLAPFSISNQLAYDPPFVFFSGSGLPEEDGAAPARKHSVVNAEDTGEFVWNMATYDLREQVNISSAHVGAARRERSRQDRRAQQMGAEAGAGLGQTANPGRFSAEWIPNRPW